MNPAVLENAIELVKRAEADGQVGEVADAAEMERLNRDLGGRIPTWYVELLSTVPLCGLEFGWQFSEPEAGDDGVSRMYWFDSANIRLESEEAYPGIAILKSGYLCVAGCAHGTGDQYFIAAGEGDDPPLYQIDHEAGEEAEEILSDGRDLVSPSLSVFFQVAKTR